MSDDNVSEVSTQSWFGRIADSIKGMLFGGALAAVAVFVLFWNEGRAVKRAEALQEGGGAVVTVSADKVDPANEGKLVHLTGAATTTETLADAEFGITTNALKLRRVAEMYQWGTSGNFFLRSRVDGLGSVLVSLDSLRLLLFVFFGRLILVFCLVGGRSLF